MLNLMRFQRLVDRLGGHNDCSLQYTSLIEAYSQPHRAYHTLAHLQDCLQQFDLARDKAERPDEVEMALWFHDAVYNPETKNNEEQSAEWATQVLQQAGLRSGRVSRIATLILYTKHDRQPETQDCDLLLDINLLLDIDLSILGQDPAIFAAYERQIRAEYSGVPEEEYRVKRAEILKNFLTRPAIYQTDFFRSRLEAQARENLAQFVGTINSIGLHSI